ncbi:hypothetical protein N0V82_002194 [Gnomoniopsis sp. IMI 355080]|nr:hypothetical protein N0V82_002194 [Gnomoniopsis sp. IMI 355080]
MSNSIQTLAAIIHQLEAQAAFRSTTLPASARTRQCTGNNGVCVIVSYKSNMPGCGHKVKDIKHCCGGKVSAKTGEPNFCARFTPKLDVDINFPCTMCRLAEAHRRNASKARFVQESAEMLEAQQAALFAEAAARH